MQNKNKIIKYPNALDSNGKLVNISEVSEHGVFYCIGCEKEMKVALGPKREHYFAHNPGVKCDPETYLHKYVKWCIKQKFDSQEPYYISFYQNKKCKLIDTCEYRKCANPQLCNCSKRELSKFDLKKNYNTCEIEKGYGYDDMKADVKLTHSEHPNREPLFIEIAVTHKCDEKKISSGKRIIEINVPKNTDDFSFLSDLEETTSYSKKNNELSIQFYNFRREVASEKRGYNSFRVYFYHDNSLKHILEQDCSLFGKRKIIQYTPFEVHVAEADYGIVASAMSLKYPQLKTCCSCDNYWRSKSDYEDNKNKCNKGFTIYTPSQANCCAGYKYSQFKTERRACGYRIEKGKVEGVCVLNQPVLYTDIQKRITVKAYGNILICKSSGGLLEPLRDKVYGYQLLDLSDYEKGEYRLYLGGDMCQKLVIQ